MADWKKNEIIGIRWILENGPKKTPDKMRKERGVDLERNGRNLEFLLKELHEKKAWLDRMIAGLEAALESPQHRLIEMTEKTFARKEDSPKVDLQERMQAELATLAARVGSSRRPKRRKPAVKAAESRRGSGR